MPIFPSVEWAEKLKEVINADKELLKLQDQLPVFDSKMLIEAKAGFMDKPFIMYIRPEKGKGIAELLSLKDINEREAAYTMQTSYDTMKGIMTGKLDMMKMVMTGKVRVKGDMKLLMQNVKHQQSFMKKLGEVDTQFIDEIKK
jgi:putative sterol carrier protein